MTPRAAGFRVDYMRVLFTCAVFLGAYAFVTDRPGALTYILLAIGAPIIGWLVRNPYGSFACGLAWGGVVLGGYWLRWWF